MNIVYITIFIVILSIIRNLFFVGPDNIVQIFMVNVNTRINNTKELGQALRQRRKEAGLTQKEAAAYAGVGTRFLSELERGKPTVQLGKTIELAKLLGLQLTLTPNEQVER